MEYTGKLYGKIGRAWIPLKLTSAEVDAMKAEMETRLKQETAPPSITITPVGDFTFVPKQRLGCMISCIASMVRNTRRYRRTVLWSVVAQAFGVGSTTATELCIQAGLNPQSYLPKIQEIPLPKNPPES